MAHAAEHVNGKSLDRVPPEAVRPDAFLTSETLSSLYNMGQVRAKADRAALPHSQHTNTTAVRKPDAPEGSDLHSPAPFTCPQNGYAKELEPFSA